MNWTEGISACIEDESRRYLLKPIPLVLISAIVYEPDIFWWLEYRKVNNN